MTDRSRTYTVFFPDGTSTVLASDDHKSSYLTATTNGTMGIISNASSMQDAVKAAVYYHLYQALPDLPNEVRNHQKFSLAELNQSGSTLIGLAKSEGHGLYVSADSVYIKGEPA